MNQEAHSKGSPVYLNIHTYIHLFYFMINKILCLGTADNKTFYQE